MENLQILKDKLRVKHEMRRTACQMLLSWGKVISVGVDRSEAILKEACVLVSKCKEHKYLQSAEGLQCQWC